MRIGVVGLGKMGVSMAMKLCRANIHVVGFDTDAQAFWHVVEITDDANKFLLSMLNASTGAAFQPFTL